MVCQKLSGTHLFGGSEEEEDADEEEDGSRFDIRPEFEGRAGHKVKKGVHTYICFHYIQVLYIITNDINGK